MPVNLRRFLTALAVMAALWQAVGAAAASLVGCCPDQQACCVLAAVQSPCSTCVPSPAPTGAMVAAHSPPVSFNPPTYDPVAELEATKTAIWRPPDERPF
jgi:hypothetical protein